MSYCLLRTHVNFERSSAFTGPTSELAHQAAECTPSPTDERCPQMPMRGRERQTRCALSPTLKACTADMEYRDAFAYYDGDRDGKITAQEFGELIRALGHAPTNAELAAVTSTIQRVYGGCTCAFDRRRRSA
jgi:hypothetical protein